MRLGLLCFSLLFGSGCYASHDTAGRCGLEVCESTEVCCMDCEGGGRCQTADLPCPVLRCTEGCSSSFECTPDEFCEFARGTCGGEGRCTPRPIVCDGDCPGVCGCDGLDYCNECEANGAGQTIASARLCTREICGDEGRARCPVDTFCCPLCFGEVECVARDVCPDVFCPAECVSNEECAPSEFCHFPTGECGPGRVPGSCEPRPAGCTADCPGVCGCDGTTHCNECVANAAGVNVDAGERCRPPVCGRGGRECGPDEYCDLGPSCGAVDGLSCRPLPAGCDDVFDPVCGCDGRTHGNECEAASAGVTVRSEGECPPPGRTCLDLMRLTPELSSGVYSVAPDGDPALVFCDLVTDGGGWTLVASTRGQTLDDAAGPYHEDLTRLDPRNANPFIWRGMRTVAGRRADVRFTCRGRGEFDDRVDLSFYDVGWYGEWTTGTDADSCFSEDDGAGFDFPPARRDNIAGVALPVGFEWSAGYLEGEDSCDDDGDFTVDFRDRGMDSNEADGTDWGEDDTSPKCGFGTAEGGVWQIWVRER